MDLYNIFVFSVSEMGCKEIGLQEGLLETVLLCILQSPQYVPIDLRFDLFVLVRKTFSFNDTLIRAGKLSYDNFGFILIRAGEQSNDNLGLIFARSPKKRDVAPKF